MNAFDQHAPTGTEPGSGTGRGPLYAVHEPQPGPDREPVDRSRLVVPDWHLIQAQRARALADMDTARAALPPVDPDTFACYLGDLVGQVEADTEADPIGVLVSLVCAAGVYLGPGPHVPTGDDRHPLLVWPLVIGRTNGGRKGASWGTASRLLTAADEAFMDTGTGNLRSGLTSGEGLAAMFTEPDPDTAGPDLTAVTERGRRGRSGGADPTEPAVGCLPPGDRRLLVFEPEWAGVIAKMKREGNSLSATLRQAWEGGNLSTLTVSARIARQSHIGLLAHITPGEFRAKASATDMAGGTYNRFLPVLVHQARILPGSTGTDPAVIERIGAQLRQRLRGVDWAGPVGFTPDGQLVWEGLYYEFFGTTTTGQTEAVEQFVSRAAPYCLRIAAIHAVLDGQRVMDTRHLVAAAGLVRYAIASARSVFGGDQHAKLLAFIAEAGPIGRTKTEITNVLFGKNASAADVDHALAPLLASGRVARTKRAPEGGRGGRPVEVFTANPHGRNGITEKPR